MRRSDNSEDVHRFVEWMVPADDPILEFMHSARTPRGEPAILSASIVGVNTGYSRKRASERLLVLTDYRLVERTSHGKYRLTDYGEKAVTGDVTLEELDDLEPQDNDDENESEN